MGKRTARHDDAGFATLTLVICTIAMVAILMSTFAAIWMADNVQMTTSGMTAAGSTSQVVSEEFTADVQGATQVSENAAAVGCGAGTLVLGLTEATGTVAYTEQAGSTSLTNELVRTVCATGSTTGTTTVARNVTAAALPLVSGSTPPGTTSLQAALQAGWVNAVYVGYISIGLAVTGDRHNVQLSGAPEAGGSQ